jgi:hypothetical protein
MSENFIFSFRVTTDLTLEIEPGAMGSKPKESRVSLDVSPNLDRDAYKDGEGITKAGLKPASITLLGGLASLIVMGHENGWWDKEKHLAYAIDYLKEMIDKAKKVEVGIITNEKPTNPPTELN